ncbi:MAG: hypothetical protein IJI01_09995 [Butyrivibrio sp.]|uniref:hypothetical protein n=1 Tax=Butyrivibrio sp. TaxID=28121 RepID=UPI0025C292A6|nr:hypothetical protein [Butyrivibrio sp.]MBQ6588998.1 hypothetical protein [Butyrivibrio sp.]
MHQVTYISYGEGTVDIVLDSTSLTEVSAPEFRFGDYSKVVTSCFTQKELDRISKGDNAELTFYFVVSDEAESEAVYGEYSSAIEENEVVLGKLNEGIYVDIDATKTFENGEAVPLANMSSDIDLQVDIPLYLVNEDRAYYYLTNNMGEYELFEDSTPDADVLTVNTDTLTSGLILYQDSMESLVDRSKKGATISLQHVFIGGIVCLIALWFFIDFFHRNPRQ